MTEQNRNYDVIIIGGGPAGYTAALYCARAALRTLVLEKFAPGGQIGIVDHVDNYPGFSEGIDGYTLAAEMQKQAERFGAQTMFGEVTEVSLAGEEKSVLADGIRYTAPAVILATGASPRELGLPKEHALRGRGVSYCATCDGAFFRDKDVAVVGGGNTAATDAVFLSKLCRSVTLIHRRDKLRASANYYDLLTKKENVHFAWDCVTTELLGDQKLSGLRIRNVKTGEEKEIPCEGVFVAVGNNPNTSLFSEVKLTENGYIEAGEDTKTNLPGVFAVGDVREKPLRQVVTAVSDGAVASHMVEEYLEKV